MWTARGINKVPLVSGSHTRRLRLGESFVGALGVACLFLAINNLRTRKPNQTTKKIQPVSLGVGGGRLFKLLAFPGPRRWCWALLGTAGHSHRHVCISTSRWHCRHLTKQHQWNLQPQRSASSTCAVWKPRPQHSSSQPSMALDVLLHVRPLVPSTPLRMSCSQKSGLGSRYTRSSSVCGLNCAFRGTSAREEPTRRGSTSVAPSNFSFSAWPTWRKGGTARQHVFTSQEPDTP